MYDRSAYKVGLFADYVNLFLKLKQEASGFPRECQNEQQKFHQVPVIVLFSSLQLQSFWFSVSAHVLQRGNFNLSFDI
jgi:hypothetical protein